MSDTDIAASLRRQLNLLANAVVSMGHTLVTENSVVVDVIENRRSASIVCHTADGVTTLANAGPHDIVVTDPAGTSHHRAKPGEPVAVYKAP